MSNQKKLSKTKKLISKIALVVLLLGACGCSSKLLIRGNASGSHENINYSIELTYIIAIDK